MSLPTRRLVAAGLCLAAGLAGTALLAPQAQAAPGLTGKQLVSTTSSYTSTPQKTQKAYCPTGKVVISGGAFIQGPTHVKLTLLRAVPDGHYFEAGAVNNWGRARWSLSTYAICADAPKGLEYLAADSAPSVGPFRHAVAVCTKGKQLLSVGGLAATEPGRNVSLTVLLPGGKGLVAAFTGSHAAEGGENDPWTTQAYAVCADPLGATVVSTQGPESSDPTRMTSVDCLPGRLVSTGAIIEPQSPGNAGEVGYGALYPDASLSTSVAIAYEDHNGWPGDWLLYSYAICA